MHSNKTPFALHTILLTQKMPRCDVHYIYRYCYLIDI